MRYSRFRGVILCVFLLVSATMVIISGTVVFTPSTEAETDLLLVPTCNAGETFVTVSSIKANSTHDCASSDTVSKYSELDTTFVVTVEGKNLSPKEIYFPVVSHPDNVTMEYVMYIKNETGAVVASYSSFANSSYGNIANNSYESFEKADLYPSSTEKDKSSSAEEGEGLSVALVKPVPYTDSKEGDGKAAKMSFRPVNVHTGKAQLWQSTHGFKNGFHKTSFGLRGVSAKQQGAIVRAINPQSRPLSRETLERYYCVFNATGIINENIATNIVYCPANQSHDLPFTIADAKTGHYTHPTVINKTLTMPFQPSSYALAYHLTRNEHRESAFMFLGKSIRLEFRAFNIAFQGSTQYDPIDLHITLATVRKEKSKFHLATFCVFLVFLIMCASGLIWTYL